jgi:Ca-activated chloride channel family protein
LQGCQLVEEGMVDGHINRVLLLTDGLANEGVTDPARLEALARQKNGEGVTTTTLGVGLDFNEDLLLRMAKEGGGAFYFIDNPDQAPTIFLEELHLLMSVVGQNLSITLTPAPEIALVRQWSGYASERAGSGMRFRMGDLYAEESKALLLELSIPALKSTGEVEIARLNFEYDELGEDSVTHRRIELPVQVKVVAAEDFASQERHPEVVKMALLMHSARAREEAIQLADVGNFAQAGQVLRQAADLIRDSQIEDPELRQQHDMLREEAVDMDLGAQRYTAYERKSHTSKLFTGGTRPFDLMATGQLHQRMKSERQAIERHGTTPTLIMWPGQAQPLSDHTRFGRAADNDIVINEDAVSAHHCEIVRSGSDFVLRDLNSRNGTFANGGRVSGEFRLSIGDVMTVGSVLFMFEGAA